MQTNENILSKPEFVVPVIIANRALVAFFALQFIFAIFLYAFWKDQPPGLNTFAVFLLMFISFILIFRKTLINSISTDSRWKTLPNPKIIIGVFILYFIMSIGFLNFAHSILPKILWLNQDEFFKGSTDFFWALGGVAVLAPLLEELIFRGFVLRAYEHARSFGFAAFTTALLFALAHANVAILFALIPGAWILARTVQVTGSIWSSVALHMLNNFAALLVFKFWGTDNSEVTPLFGILGLFSGVVCFFIFQKWFGLPPRLPQSNKQFISASLIVFIFICILGMIIPPEVVPSH